jgi:hypothetical protein
MKEKATDVVVLVGRDASGRIVHAEQIPLSDWYDKEQPLIDNDDECRRRGIRVLEGSQIDAIGQVYKRWRHTMDENGALIDSEELDEETLPEPVWQRGGLTKQPATAAGFSAHDQLKARGLLPSQLAVEAEAAAGAQDSDSGQLELPID